MSWAEAHLLLMSKMLDDSTSSDKGQLQNVSLFELECNNPGLGISFKIDGNKTSYYIPDDPGNVVAK